MKHKADRSILFRLSLFPLKLKKEQIALERGHFSEKQSLQRLFSKNEA